MLGGLVQLCGGCDRNALPAAYGCFGAKHSALATSHHVCGVLPVYTAEWSVVSMQCWFEQRLAL